MESNGRVKMIRTVEQIIYDTIPQLQQNNGAFPPHEPYNYQQYPGSQYIQHPFAHYGDYANQRKNFQNNFLTQAPSTNKSQHDSHSASFQMEMIRQRMREQQQQQPICLSPLNMSLNTTVSEPTVREEPNSTVKNSSANFDSVSSSASSSRDESLSFGRDSKRSITTSTPIANRTMSFRKEPMPRLSCIPPSPNRINNLETIPNISLSHSVDNDITQVRSSKNSKNNNSTIRASNNVSKNASRNVSKNVSVVSQKNVSVISQRNASTISQKDASVISQRNASAISQKDTSRNISKNASIVSQNNNSVISQENASIVTQKNASRNESFRQASKNASTTANNTVVLNRSMKLRDETNTIKGIEESLQRSNRKFDSKNDLNKDELPVKDTNGSPENAPRVIREEPKYVHKDTPALLRFKALHVSSSRRIRSTSLTFSPQKHRGSIRDLANKSRANTQNRTRSDFQTCPISEFQQLNDSPLSPLNSPNVERNFEELLSQTRKNRTLIQRQTLPEQDTAEQHLEVIQQSIEEATAEPEMKDHEPELEEVKVPETEMEEVKDPEPESEEMKDPELESEEVKDQETESNKVEGQEPELKEVENQKPESKDVEDLQQEMTEMENQEPELIEVENQEPEMIEVENQEPELTGVRDQEPETTENKDHEPEVTEVKDQEPEVTQIKGQEPEVTEVQDQEPEVQQVCEKETRNVTAATTFCNISVQVTPNLYTKSHWDLDNDSCVFDSSESRDRITVGGLTEGFSDTSIKPENKSVSVRQASRRSSRLLERSFSSAQNENEESQESSDSSNDDNENVPVEEVVPQLTVPQMEISLSQDDDDEFDKDSDKENRPPTDFVPGDSGNHIQDSDDEFDEEEPENEPIIDEEQDILMSEDSQPEHRMPYIEEIIEENVSLEPVVCFPSSDDENSDELLYDETFHAFTKLDRSSFVVKRKSETPLSPPQEKRFKPSPEKISPAARASLETSLEGSRRMVLGEINLPFSSTLANSEYMPCDGADFSETFKTVATLDRSSEEKNGALDSQDSYGDSIEDLLQEEIDKQLDDSFSERRLVDYSESMIQYSKTSIKNVTKSIRESTKNPLVNYSSVIYDETKEDIYEENFVNSKLNISRRPVTKIEVLGEVGEETFEREFNPNATYIKSSVGQSINFRDDGDDISEEEEAEEVQEKIKSMVRNSLSNMGDRATYSNRLVDYSICSSSDDNNSCFGNDNDERLSSFSEDEESRAPVRHESIKKTNKKASKKPYQNHSLEDSAVSMSSSDNDVVFDVSNADAVIRPKKNSSPSTKGLRRSKRNRVPICALWFGQKPVYRPEIDKYGNYVQSLVGVTSARVAPISERRYVPRQKATSRKNKSGKSHHHHKSNRSPKKHRRRVVVESDSDSCGNSQSEHSSSESESDNEYSHKTTNSQKSKNKPIEAPKKRNMSQFLEMSIHAPAEELPQQEESEENEPNKHFLNFSGNDWTETKSPGVYNCVQSKDINGASGSMKFMNFAQRNNYKCSNYSLSCWVSYGVFLVTVGTHSRVVKPGDFFKVPIGGGYSLHNLRDDQGLINYQLLFSKISSK